MNELAIDDVASLGARVKFLALGSAACRCLNHFFLQQTCMSDLCLAVDTDLRCLESLDSSLAKYCFGKNVFRGLSSGGDENLIKDVFDKADPVIQTFCQKSDVLIVLAGLGGGTGSGMVIPTLQIAKQAGTFVLVISIMPFSFEGKNKSIKAQALLKAVQSLADLTVPFFNDILFQNLSDSSTIKEAFCKGDDLLGQLTQSFFLSLTQVDTGAFVCNLSSFMQHFSNKPDSVFWGFGRGDGENAVGKALKSVLECPSLKVRLDLAPIQSAFIYTNLTSDITLTDLKNLNYELQSFLGVPDLQILNNCHSNLGGIQKAEIFVLLSSCKKNLKAIRYKNKKQKSNSTSNIQIQFDFETQGIESYWDTPTYLRLGLKLES